MSDEIKKLAAAFARIFSGLVRSSGRYVVPDGATPDEKGKVLGRAWTSTRPITEELWVDHLTGKKATVTDEERGEALTGAVGLGVVPIRDDNTCVFGAIDIDVYPLDLQALVARVVELKLPVVVCRTKSGGAHVYLFLKEPTGATLVRERLQEWSVALNHPGVEIFPKQSILSSYTDGAGSWINVPYSGGKRSLRYAFGDDGKAINVEEFVEAVDAKAVTAAFLEDFELPKSAAPDERFAESPPCLETLARIGFGDWSNNSMFNIAVYLRLRFVDTWKEEAAKYNEAFMTPPLTQSELGQVLKSVAKKNYFYKCKDQPISAVCNRGVCLRREFGISGGNDPGIVLGDLARVETDPVIWVWNVDGAELELATGELMDQRRFATRVVERLSKWPKMLRPASWEELVKTKVANASTIVVPEDGTKSGQFWSHLANFCTGRARGKALDDILRGVAFTDKKAERVYFRSTDFFAYLTAHRFVGATEREAWGWLRPKGVEAHKKSIKGNVVNYWSVPAFPEQTEEHDVPRKPREEM